MAQMYTDCISDTKFPENSCDFSLATITVSFNPDIIELRAQMLAIPSSAIKVIIDNASGVSDWQALEKLSLEIKNIHLIRNKTNLGLASAINKGAEFLSVLPIPPTYILLLDQDSKPEQNSILKLVSAFEKLQQKGHSVGCVGPQLVDINTGLSHGFHQSTKFKWIRNYPANDSSTPIQCANLNGSGTLVPLQLFNRINGLDEQLFIDHIDTEWSFRMISKGYELWGIPDAKFKHSMGENSTRFWFFGWRIWPVRSPLRHFYLFRNAILLIHRPYIPKVWKFWAIIKLLLTVSIVSGLGPLRIQQIKNMYKGIKQGINDRAK